MQKHLLIIGLLLSFSFAAFAQKPQLPVKKNTADSIQAKHDSLKSKPFVPKIGSERLYFPDSNHSPHKAVIHSLLIPGWGQVYNKRWWKVPLIYAALGSLGVLYIRNSRYYKEDLAIAKFYEKGTAPGKDDPYYKTYQQYQLYGVTSTSLNDLVRGDARNRDLCALGFVGFWGIQAIDAYIDAKFIHSYTMDNNFSVKVVPSMITPPTTMYAQNINGSYIPGLKITFTLK